MFQTVGVFHQQPAHQHDLIDGIRFKQRETVFGKNLLSIDARAARITPYPRFDGLADTFNPGSESPVRRGARTAKASSRRSARHAPQQGEGG